VWVSIRRAAVTALAISCVVVGLSAPAHASLTFFVEDTSDSSADSLREAITELNAGVPIDTIEFRIPGSGVHTITLDTNLPAITKPVTLTGYTQDGAAPATATSAAALKIVIDGVHVDTGLVVRANYVTVSGLVVHNVAASAKQCGGAGICVVGDHDTVSGNYVGVGFGGLIAIPNAGPGVRVIGNNNTVGGTGPEARNLISGNKGGGVTANGTGNNVTGNSIGSDVAGTGALRNVGAGVSLTGGAGSVSGNLISGNDKAAGVDVGATANGSTITGNVIGTDITETHPLPNETGVELRGDNNIVGGTDAGAANVLSGNIHDGLVIDPPGNVNTVEGNLIGVTHALAPMPNQRLGVSLLSGVLNAVSSNTIAYNGAAGVLVDPLAADDRILGNSIHDNAGLSIDLWPIGTNTNDGDDSDVGANDQQNYPVITGVSPDGLTVGWSLTSTPDSPFRLEFFSGPSCAAAGTTLVGTDRAVTGPVVNPTRNGTTPLAVPVVAGSFLVATATEVSPTGELDSTSEFSVCFLV
jgi:hypothetical protein